LIGKPSPLLEHQEHADVSATEAPNHHADYPGFSGVSGLIAGLSMVAGRGAVARLAADLARVTAADRVVDVGCGPGAAAREAARRGATVWGVDPTPVMLRLARIVGARGRRVTWLEGAAEALPLPDAAATVLWSLSTVHHWPDLKRGLAEAFRVLAPGGRLLAIERRRQPGTTGMASHGWTDEQAQSFADSCVAAGFVDPHIAMRRTGRREYLIVTAARSRAPC
jgi:ubiquinone/menaquinone biosynthesis C-methylase UbiE